jgi:hypothetical protein
VKPVLKKTNLPIDGDQYNYSQSHSNSVNIFENLSSRAVLTSESIQLKKKTSGDSTYMSSSPSYQMETANSSAKNLRLVKSVEILEDKIERTAERTTNTLNSISSNRILNSNNVLLYQKHGDHSQQYKINRIEFKQTNRSMPINIKIKIKY